MRRDSKAFRERFQRWKAGEAVYDNGKPIEHYADGTESSELFNIGQEYYRRSRELPHVIEYDIPYIKDKEITLTDAGLATGARLSTNLLDSIAKHAVRANLPIKTAIGLATKESTLGNPTDDSSVYSILSPEKVKMFRRLGRGQHINQGDAIRPRNLLNYYADTDPYLEAANYALNKSNGDTRKQLEMLKGGLRYADKKAEEYKKRFPNGDKNLMQAAFELFKNNPNKYNPGQRNYAELVNKRAEEVWKSPEIQAWYEGYQRKQNLFKDIKNAARQIIKTVKQPRIPNTE